MYNFHCHFSAAFSPVHIVWPCVTSLYIRYHSFKFCDLLYYLKLSICLLLPPSHADNSDLFRPDTHFSWTLPMVILFPGSTETKCSFSGCDWPALTLSALLYLSLATKPSIAFNFFYGCDVGSFLFSINPKYNFSHWTEQLSHFSWCPTDLSLSLRIIISQWSTFVPHRPNHPNNPNLAESEHFLVIIFLYLQVSKCGFGPWYFCAVVTV